MHTQREAWLLDVAQRIAPWFDGTVPGLRVSVGFSSKGRRSKVIGECWSPEADPDGRCHIFVHPSLTDPVEVAGTLAHEMVHAVVGCDKKHGPVFKRAGAAIGLDGPAKNMGPGPIFRERIAPILAAVGPYPHGELRAGGAKSTPPKQDTRMIKASCACGYTVRASRKWLAQAIPSCPLCEVVMEVAA